MTSTPSDPAAPDADRALLMRGTNAASGAAPAGGLPGVEAIAEPTLADMNDAFSMIAAMERADQGSSMRLIRLIDGDETWEGRVGDQRQEFAFRDEAADWVADLRRESRARALARVVLAIRARLAAAGTGDAGRGVSPRPFAGAPRNGSEVWAYRPDAGWFAVARVHPAHDDGTGPDENQGMIWCTVTGEDLTNDLPTLYLPNPVVDDSAPTPPATPATAAAQPPAAGGDLREAADIVARMAGEHQTGTAVQGLLRAAHKLRERTALAAPSADRGGATEGWQPIETAPSRPHRARTSGMCLDDDKLTWFVDGYATHWQPRPAPPTTPEVRR